MMAVTVKFAVFWPLAPEANNYNKRPERKLRTEKRNHLLNFRLLKSEIVIWLSSENQNFQFIMLIYQLLGLSPQDSCTNATPLPRPLTATTYASTLQKL